MSTPSLPENHHKLPHSLAEWRAMRKPVRDINREHEASLGTLDRLAVWITEKVGTMGFFLLILVWTLVWTGYNILASEVPRLHWIPFDPFPAFVAYLLISNVIQILLMPLIMVGQNVQGAHAELRAQNDFEVNLKAEQEIEVILMHLERQQALLMELVRAQGIKLDAVLTGPLAPPPSGQTPAPTPQTPNTQRRAEGA